MINRQGAGYNVLILPRYRLLPRLAIVKNVMLLKHRYGVAYLRVALSSRWRPECTIAIDMSKILSIDVMLREGVGSLLTTTAEAILKLLLTIYGDNGGTDTFLPSYSLQSMPKNLLTVTFNPLFRPTTGTWPPSITWTSRHHEKESLL